MLDQTGCTFWLLPFPGGALGKCLNLADPVSPPELGRTCGLACGLSGKCLAQLMSIVTSVVCTHQPSPGVQGPGLRALLPRGKTGWARGCHMRTGSSQGILFPHELAV